VDTPIASPHQHRWIEAKCLSSAGRDRTASCHPRTTRAGRRYAPGTRPDRAARPRPSEDRSQSTQRAHGATRGREGQVGPARGRGHHHCPKLRGCTTAGVKAKPSGRPAAGLDPGSTPPTNHQLSAADVDTRVDVCFDAPKLRASGPDQPRNRQSHPLDGIPLHRYAGRGCGSPSAAPSGNVRPRSLGPTASRTAIEAPVAGAAGFALVTVLHQRPRDSVTKATTPELRSALSASADSTANASRFRRSASVGRPAHYGPPLHNTPP
jgi:hypothetical protein